MNDDLVEKVAKAIYEVEGQDLLQWGTLKSVAPQARQACIDAARRAIKVMKQETRSGDFHKDAVREIYEQSAQAIDDYDRREAAGETMEWPRPRMPGGSDF